MCLNPDGFLLRSESSDQENNSDYADNRVKKSAEEVSKLAPALGLSNWR